MFNPELEKDLLVGSDGCCGDPPIWITRQHERLRLNEMEDAHLLNSLLKVQREYPWRQRFHRCLSCQARKRGLI